MTMKDDKKCDWGGHKPASKVTFQTDKNGFIIPGTYESEEVKEKVIAVIIITITVVGSCIGAIQIAPIIKGILAAAA